MSTNKADQFSLQASSKGFMHTESYYRAVLDSILPTVEKPARYVGGEWNHIAKDPSTVSTRIALCFP
ncbi:MAG TPA: hypothetical protein VLZ81_11920, partial [Blastocatellia bacterium]|nr:hypothetical protein [Blastocatellia bacterium]